jgi:hypothetical protein
VKTFKGKGLEKLFDYFKFLNPSLTWFLMVPFKDGFVDMGVMAI